MANYREGDIISVAYAHSKPNNEVYYKHTITNK